MLSWLTDLLVQVVGRRFRAGGEYYLDGYKGYQCFHWRPHHSKVWPIYTCSGTLTSLCPNICSYYDQSKASRPENPNGWSTRIKNFHFANISGYLGPNWSAYSPQCDPATIRVFSCAHIPLSKPMGAASQTPVGTTSKALTRPRRSFSICTKRRPPISPSGILTFTHTILGTTPQPLSAIQTFSTQKTWLT